MAFKTKGEREATGEPIRSGPFEDVPEHLQPSLDAVLRGFAYVRGSFQAGRVRQLERVTRIPNLLHGPASDAGNYDRSIEGRSGEGTLELLDGVLELAGDETAEHVDQILTEAGSVFHVVHRGIEMGRLVFALERRIPTHIDAAIAALKHAQAHLEAARSLIFGRAPDYKTGLHECVCAVEAASIPIAEPNNTKATLGRVIGELSNSASKYIADRPASVALFVSLADSLWQLQSPHRHGTPVEQAPVPITREEAESAFWLTVTLSTWCERGNLRRV